LRTDIETTTDIRARFHKAFARYAAADGVLRSMRSALPDGSDSASIFGVNAQFEVLRSARVEYERLRRAYIHRLLTDVEVT
jgi:hypothetical protein